MTGCAIVHACGIGPYPDCKVTPVRCKKPESLHCRPLVLTLHVLRVFVMMSSHTR